jgi:hypothetical protein
VRGGNISETQIVELPIALRNPVALALTLPGVSTNRFAFGRATFSANGGRGRSNNFLIDGTENNDISIAGQGFQITNPDAVQEVSVQTGNYDAEFGRAGGAVVNTITKTGTNEFHGTLSYLLDSRADDAITNTESGSAAIVERGSPPFGIEQWFSGTFGGPLYLPRFGEGGPSIHSGRDRTFFFVAYQQQRQRSSSSLNVITLSPTGRAALRALFPAGTNPRVDNYLAVTSAVDATSAFFTQNLSNGTPIEFGRALVQFPQQFTEPQFQLRIDHRIGDNDQLAGRFLYSNQNVPAGFGATGLPGFFTSNTNQFRNFWLSETHVFSPSLTNELRVSYGRLVFDFPLDPANPLGLTLPGITIAGITNLAGAATPFGIAANFPQGRIANNYVVQDTMTYVTGDHTFRFGTDLLLQRSKQFAPINERGALTYNASGNLSSFANFVDDFAGSGGGATRDFGSPLYYPELFRQAYFFQDRWKATPALTLTLGLRYENFGTPINNLRTPAFTGLFNVDPVTLAGPYDDPNTVKRDNNNFAPTFGVAWAPSFTGGLLGRLFGENRTVFRGGYQVGYDSFFNNIASNAATSSPNLVSTATPTSTAGGTTPRGTPGLSSLLPTTARPLNPRDAQNVLVDPELVNPYYQRWSVGMQRELPGNFLLDVSYVGSKGTKLFLNEDLNPSVPAELRVTPAGYTGPTTGRLDNIQGQRVVRGNAGSSSYHSGQFNLSRRFTDNFSTTVAYTWSKFIDNGSELFASAGLVNSSLAIIPTILGGERNERAVSLFDRTHRASITYVYALPFMREQRGFAGRVLGGWEVSGVTTFETGTPYTVTNGQDSNNFAGNNDRPDYNPLGAPGTRAIPFVATAAANVCNAPAGAVFYTTAPNAAGSCINPADAEFIGVLGGVGRTGNLGRNTERTRGLNNFDVNLTKRINITEGVRLDFRTEFFNILNHPQYGTGSISPFSPAGTGPTATVFTSAAGQFLRPEFGDGGGRVVRYQLKLVF